MAQVRQSKLVRVFYGCNKDKSSNNMFGWPYVQDCLGTKLNLHGVLSRHRLRRCALSCLIQRTITSSPVGDYSCAYWAVPKPAVSSETDNSGAGPQSLARDKFVSQLYKLQMHVLRRHNNKSIPLAPSQSDQHLSTAASVEQYVSSNLLQWNSH